MSRGLSSEVTTALATNGFRLATLIYIEVGNSIYRITDFGVDLTDLDFQLYTSSADLIDIASVSETGALRVNSFDLVLSGANQAFISAFLQNDYIDKRALIKRAVVSSENAVTGSFVFFDGRISSFKIEDSESDSKLSISIASHWSDFEKVNNRKTNLNSQKVHFPNDLGFQYASKVVKDLRWGRKS